MFCEIEQKTQAGEQLGREKCVGGMKRFGWRDVVESVKKTKWSCSGMVATATKATKTLTSTTTFELDRRSNKNSFGRNCCNIATLHLLYKKRWSNWQR
jgi:uncharacterized protein (DUF169 family)